MSLETQIAALATAIGSDIAVMQGIIAGLGSPAQGLYPDVDLQPGELINIYLLNRAPHVRLATASIPGRQAHGYVLSAFAAGDTGCVVCPDGIDTALTGLTGDQYLSTVAGACTDTPPSGTGQTLQPVGTADVNGNLQFVPGDATTI